MGRVITASIKNLKKKKKKKKKDFLNRFPGSAKKGGVFPGSSWFTCTTRLFLGVKIVNIQIRTHSYDKIIMYASSSLLFLPQRKRLILRNIPHMKNKAMR
jgi:hypothetical protein